MNENSCLSMVRDIMMEFAGLTGLLPTGNPQRRYLWTDAFAVCNFLELYDQTGDERCRRLAFHLVEQVHAMLGRHRDDDPRTGWISGLDEQDGRTHPTIGGLRIGKKMNEREPSDPVDETLEWDRDGQYYHYLTKWMHALNRVSSVTGDATYNRWATELAKTAHARFTYLPLYGRKKQMYWKMSIDLSRPLVRSMGHHDPLDGYITYSQLQATSSKYTETSRPPELTAEIADMAKICEGKSWVTDDPLGIGELLCSACKVTQLIISNKFKQGELLEMLLESSLPGLESYVSGNPFQVRAKYRLAFRELGLSIGLHAVEKMRGLILQNPRIFNERHRLRSRIDALMCYVPSAETIETFWRVGKNRATGIWNEHREINMVMLATSLAPGGYLAI